MAAYEAARASGGYDLSCYMMANESEYWAEGTQAWFDATVREGACLLAAVIGGIRMGCPAARLRE